MTFEDVEAEKKKLIATFNGELPKWFKGAGISYDPSNGNAPILKINLNEDEDIYKLHEHIKDNMPELTLYRVDFVGEIVAL